MESRTDKEIGDGTGEGGVGEKSGPAFDSKPATSDGGTRGSGETKISGPIPEGGKKR